MGLATTELCDCGQERTINCIIEMSPILLRLHETEDTINWLKNYGDKKALAK